MTQTPQIDSESCRHAFQNLVVWQRAIELSLAVYDLTRDFPSLEQFGLTNQLRRASVSVPSNIAEGYGRTTKGEYVLFLGHSRGSNCEVLTQLFIASKLKFGEEAKRIRAEDLANEVNAMLVAMIHKLKNKN